MSLIIREISYNTFNNTNQKETVSVDLSVKFGMDKINFNERIILLELNMDGITDEEEPTRRLFVVASFNYIVEQEYRKETDFKNSDDYSMYLDTLLKDQPDNDKAQLIAFLNEVNQLITNMTGFEKNRKSLDVSKAIEMYEKEMYEKTE